MLLPQFVTHFGYSSVVLGNVQIIHHHGLSFHCYADDTQLYLSTKPSTPLPSQSLFNCLQNIKTWMSSSFLKLNSAKTEFMVVASKALLRKVGDLLLDIDGSSICPSPEVRSLGVILDSTLSFQSYIKPTTKSAFYHLKNISRLRTAVCGHGSAHNPPHQHVEIRAQNFQCGCPHPLELSPGRDLQCSILGHLQKTTENLPVHQSIRTYLILFYWQTFSTIIFCTSAICFVLPFVVLLPYV